MKSFVLKNYNLERKRRIKSLNVFDSYALKDWNKIIKDKKLSKYKKEFKNYFNFCKNLNYLHHNGKIYFSHPLRVATIAYKLRKYSKSHKNLLKLALFHNVIETSSYRLSFLKKLLGKQIIEQIKILTVNRKKQWNSTYKRNYYKRICSHNKNTRLIKIIDKLDNLFIIGLCKSNLTRERYIKEIETFILPMVEKDIPFLGKYFNGLIKQSYNLGYYKNKYN